MSTSKILTILIPVYNGEKFIGSLLESFAAYSRTAPLGQEFLDSCELLVVNNRSEDSTLEIAHSFEAKIANLRVVTPETHVPSAEENAFRSFKLAGGEYTWVLGCDDIVRFEAFPEVLQVAREAVYDMAVFNFMQCDQNGRMESFCNFFMQDHAYEGELVSLTQRVGFWWLIAGFSGQIVRTAKVAGYDHPGLIAKTSPIYSHVTAYLECLAGCPAAILNIQNVVYRLSDNDIGHWRRAAARLNVFDEYFWTLGYIRQIAYLEQKGIVGRDYLIRMLETNRDSVFRPTSVIYDKLLAQVIAMTSDRDPRNRMTRSEFEEVVTFFEERDLLARPFLSATREIFEKLDSGLRISADMCDMARWRLQCYQSSFPLAANCVGVDGDYEVYELSHRFYAVHRLFRGAMLDRIRYLDRAGWSPVVFEGKSRDEIAERIAKDGVGMDFDNFPAAAMRYCSQPVHHGAQAWNSPAPVRPDFETDSYQIAGQSSAIQAALYAAQVELRTTYKARKSIVTRLAAWFTAQNIKVTRWLLKPRRLRVRLEPKSPALST